MAKQYKRYIKMEKAVRLETLGRTDAEIAGHLDMSPAGLAQMKRDPDYDRIRMRILTGVISDLDAGLTEDMEYQREKVRSMVPAALDGLYELAVQTSDNRIRLNACSEILDREGRLAKVSRVGLPTVDQGGAGTTVDDAVASSLVEAMINIQHLKVEDAENDSTTKITSPGSTRVN